MDDGSSSSSRDDRLSGQLLTASGKGLDQLVRLLLSRGADVNYPRPGDGWTALMAACSGGHSQTAQILLDSGADLSATASDGFFALLEACACGHRDVVELLLARGASPSTAAPDGTAPLILASLRGYDSVVELLLEHGGDVAQTKPCGFSAFQAACANGHATVVKRLLAHDGERSCRGLQGEEALVRACGSGHTAVAQVLLESGVPPAATSQDGHSALLQACMASHREVAALLIRHGADLEEAVEFALKRNLPGVRRVLAGLRSAQKAAPETRDLDSLVHAIEGSASSSAQMHATAENAAPATGQSAASRRRQLRETHAVPPPTELAGPPVEPAPHAATVVPEPASRSPSGDEREMLQGTHIADAATSAGTDLAGKGQPTGLDAAPPDQLGVVSPQIKPNSGQAPAELELQDELPEAEFNAAATGASEPPEATELAEADCRSTSMQTPKAVESPEQVLSLDSAMPPSPKAMCSSPAADTLKARLLHMTLLQHGFGPQGSTAGTVGTESHTSSTLLPSASARLALQLLTASSKGHAELAQKFLAKRADPNHVRSTDGWTPLMAACAAGQESIVALLMEEGVSTDVVASDGFTPLLEASAGGHSDVVRILLEKGASASKAAPDGTTALILACLHGHVEVVSLLLQYGSKVSQPTTKGFTALRAACGNGNASVTKLLLGHSAGDSAEDAVASLRLACANGHVQVVQLLLEHGVSAESRSDDGTSMLMAACMSGHHEVAATLIAHGADPEKALDTTKQKSGIKRVLARARPLAKRTQDAEQPVQKLPEASAAEIEVLAQEIEGPSKAAEPRNPPAPSIKRRAGRVSSGSGHGNLGAAMRMVSSPEDNALPPAASHESSRSSSVSSADMLLRLARSGQHRHGQSSSAAATMQKKTARPTAMPASFRPQLSSPPKIAYPPAALPTAPRANEALDATAEPQLAASAPTPSSPSRVAAAAPGRADAGQTSPRGCPRTSGPSTQQRFPRTSAWDAGFSPDMVNHGWSLKHMPAARSKPCRRSPGTFYSVEVLGAEPGPPSEHGCRSDASASSWSEATGGGQVQQSSAIVAARCKGWPVSALTLIPYDDAELADAARLVQGGIALVTAFGASGGDWDNSEVRTPSPTSRTSSSPRSLPDRDAPEMYKAWCLELQRRYCAAAEARRCGSELVAFC
eukprot:TRINITY_DN121037_c0_g1_i1.p1 TRINITY_DN121037_c0_g1~~TRINITY_DN121037_c0_g1_i1.p1  ORF type:complete len:1164 (+),score=237.91 TRINITY_DN121037_c0_g1_i1:132-3623(+)